MIKLYICCLVLIIGSVEVGPDIDMKFHQEVMEIVSYDNKFNQLICSIVKAKRKKLQTLRMVLRAVIKVIVPGPPEMGFVRIFDLPHKGLISFIVGYA